MWLSSCKPTSEDKWVEKVLTDLSDHKLWGMVCPCGLYTNDELFWLPGRERRGNRNSSWQLLKMWRNVIIWINMLKWRDESVSCFNSRLKIHQSHCAARITFKIPEVGSQLVHNHFSACKRVDTTIIRSKVIKGCQKDLKWQSWTLKEVDLL